jgi:hypothetical protein
MEAAGQIAEASREGQIMKPIERELRTVLRYEPKTGHFYWLRQIGRSRLDVPAGDTTRMGYRRVKYRGKSYMIHVLAWLFMTGEWPSKSIDHKNCDRADNKWRNLRLATASQNVANSKKKFCSQSGFTGVRKLGHRQRWSSTVYHERKHIYVGTFDSPEQAYAAHLRMARKLRGEFFRERIAA